MRSRTTRALATALTLTLCLALAPAPAGAGDGASAGDADELDPVALAALLIRDGNLDRAAILLADVDPAAEGVDTARVHTLRGVVALQRGAHLDAVRELEAARAAGNEDPLLWVFLAQAHHGAGAWRAALDALDAWDHSRAEQDATDTDGADDASGAALWLLRAQCHWRLDERPAAYAALETGRAVDPRDRELQRQQALLLVDLGLYRAAAEAGAAFLDRKGADGDDAVAFAEALRRGGDADRAAHVLETARLRFPEHEGVLRQLVRCHLDAERPYAAAELLAGLARTSPERAAEVAELFRRAGHLQRALSWNAQVPDPVAKARQRMGLLVELERHEEAAALIPRLRRLGLLTDDSVAYAASYAQFRTGHHDAAERLLRGIGDREVFERAVALRRAIDACRAQALPCE